MRAAPGVLAVVVGLLLAVPASAGAELPEIQTTLAPDGGPRLTAFTASPGGTTRWRVCSPDCGAVVAEGQGFTPGPTAAGTTFEATTTAADGTTTSSRTPAWQGQVGSTSPPTLAGTPRIGRPIVAQPGTWTGGWGDEFSSVGLLACRTPGATDCRAVGSGYPFGPARSATAAIDPAFAGWYVGAYEHRYARSSVFPAVASVPVPFGTPADRRLPVAGAGATVAYGPLAGPVPGPQAGTPPRVTGRFAVGRKVTPRPGTWPDAPDGGRIATTVRACPTRRDTARCVLLNTLSTPVPGAGASPGADDRPGPGTPVTLGPEHLGWYLGAVDRHRAPDTLDVASMPGSPEVDRAVPAPDLVTIRGPLSATPVTLGFTPRATIVRRVARGPRALRLGTVRCAERCVARVTLRAGGRTVRQRIEVRAGRTTPVSVRATTFRRARAIRTVVAFDDHPKTVRRTVRVR